MTAVAAIAEAARLWLPFAVKTSPARSNVPQTVKVESAVTMAAVVNVGPAWGPPSASSAYVSPRVRRFVTGWSAATMAAAASVGAALAPTSASQAFASRWTAWQPAMAWSAVMMAAVAAAVGVVKASYVSWVCARSTSPASPPALGWIISSWIDCFGIYNSVVSSRFAYIHRIKWASGKQSS